VRRGSLVESLPVSELPVFTPLPVARLHPHLHIQMFSISLSLDDETMKHEKKTFPRVTRGMSTIGVPIDY
jgi:hypothetical protein